MSAIDTNATSELPSPKELIRIVLRRKWIVVGVLMMSVLFGLGVIFLLPRTYSSEAKLFARMGHETLTLDPTATTGQTVQFEKTEQNEMNSLLEVFQSRRVAELIVERVGQDRILNGREPGSSQTGENSAGLKLNQMIDSLKGQLDRLIAPIRALDPISDQELAIEKFQKRIEVWAPPQATVISITYRAASPQVAQVVVDAAVDIFMEEHARLNRTHGSREFFTQQVDLLRDELAAKSECLRDRKNQYELLSIEGKRRTLEDAIGSVQLEALTVNRDIAAAKSTTRRLGQTLAEMSPTTVTQVIDGVPHLAWDGMRQRLYELEIEERRLLARYSAEHPEVSNVREQREALIEVLDAQPENRQQTTNAINPTYQTLEVALRTEESNLSALEARDEMLAMQTHELRDRLTTLNSQELEIAQLEREVELLASDYTANAEKLEQARIDEALQGHRISSINVAQAATFVARPVSPQKRLTLLLSLLVGLFGSLGLAFTLEYFDSSLRTADQTEAMLDVPVLLTLPKSRQYHRSLLTEHAT